MLWEVRGLRAKPRRRIWEMDTGGTAWRWGENGALQICVPWKRARTFRATWPCEREQRGDGLPHSRTVIDFLGVFLYGICLPFFWSQNPRVVHGTVPPLLLALVLADDSVPSPRWSYDSGLRESAYPILSGHNDWSKNRPVTQLSSMRSTFWTSMELLVKSRLPLDLRLHGCDYLKVKLAQSWARPREGVTLCPNSFLLSP